MNGTKLLLDTNIVLYLMSGDKTIADLINEKRIYLSFITELELLSYNNFKKKHLNSVNSFINQCTIIDINSQVKNEAILIRKKYKLKLPDSIVLATSLYLQIPLVTSDKGFKKVESDNVIIYEL